MMEKEELDVSNMLALIMKIKWLTRLKKIKEDIKREVKIEPKDENVNE